MAVQQSLPPKQPNKPGKSRLPALQGILNKRAQQIIIDHMHHSTTQSSISSEATVPVLMQLDSTAPRTARTHDISHLRDHPVCLNPKIPPSLIEEQDHIYETSFLPMDTSSVYQEADGLWYTKVFPSSTPSSRTDAVRLDAWITRSLEMYKKTCTNKEDLAKAVDDLVPILSVALHEIVRQVMHQCIERGLVLEKIWQTYVNLFNRVLNQMQESLRTEKQKTTEVHEILLGTRRELEGLKKSHPDHMQGVIADLEEQFTTKQRRVEEELLECEAENQRLKQELRTVHGELELWYPSFSLYQDSYLKNHIPHYSHHGHHHVRHAEEEVSPEVAIAEDFKRLLAVLAPDKRQLIGKELTYVLKAAAIATKPEKPDKHKKEHKTRLSQIVAEGQRHAEEEAKMTALNEEVAQQEQKINELRETIKELEREEQESAHLQADAGSVLAGQDADGVSLGQRRATAAPSHLVAAPLGGRHGRRLHLPG